MRVFVESLLVQLLFTPYLAYVGGKALPSKGPWRMALYTLLGAEVLLYIVGYTCNSFLPDEVMSGIMQISGVYLMAVIYGGPLVIVIDILGRLDKKHHGRYARLSERQAQNVRLGLFALVTAVVVFVVVQGDYNVRHPRIRHMELKTAKSDPQGKRGKLRIALLTDTHISESITYPIMKNVIQKTMAFKPDLILIGGDYIDFTSNYAYKPDMMRAFTHDLHAPLGKYYVLGNHEYRADMDKKKAWVGLTGGKLLIDEIAYPGDSLICLVGRDDKTNKHRMTMQEVTRKADRTLPVILLDHQPNTMEELKANGVDIALGGHTHAGQLWPMTWMVKLVFEDPFGLQQDGLHTNYISSGAGAAFPAYRIGSRSEIVIIDLIL